MAELTYNDVRRAAQEAVKELQNSVNGLKINSEDIRRNVQKTTSSQDRLYELSSRLEALQNQMTNLDSTLRNQHESLSMLQGMQQSLSEMHQRLNAAEDLLKYLYDYFMNQQQLRRSREQGIF